MDALCTVAAQGCGSSKWRGKPTRRRFSQAHHVGAKWSSTCPPLYLVAFFTDVSRCTMFAVIHQADGDLIALNMAFAKAVATSRWDEPGSRGHRGSV